MTDLDGALRTMLQSRSHDITTVPAHIGRFEADGDIDQGLLDPYTARPRSHSRRAAWLVAASAAIALAVVAGVLALSANRGHHGTPPATNPPSPTPSTSTPAPHIQSRVSLSWFGMADLPGYTAHERDSLPGYQWLALRRNSDTGMPVGCNGCESASVYVFVFGAGKFDPGKDGISTGKPVTINGKPGVLGTAKWYGVAKHRVPSVAWQFRPGRWALVQGVTASGGSKKALLTVADAVRPTASVPIGVPCTFGYLPPLPIVDIEDDRAEGYALVLTMGEPTGRSFTITLWNGTSWRYYDPKGTARHTIGGLPGYYGRQQGAGVLFHGGGMALTFSDPTGLNGDTVTEADDVQTRRVLAGIHWANGDGRQPWIAADAAIP